jgi:hypothetical protein
MAAWWTTYRSAKRARCQADIVIAVNVGSPLLKADEIGSLLSVSAQMVNILTEQNVSRSLATLKPTDIYIKPDLEGITAGDFKRTAETADRGAKAAEALADRLRPLAVSESAYAAWSGKSRSPGATRQRSMKSRSPVSNGSIQRLSSAIWRPGPARQSTPTWSEATCCALTATATTRTSTTHWTARCAAAMCCA